MKNKKKARVISIANQKGGVSKTTTTVNFGSMLSFIWGKKILLIDSDAQGNMTDNLGFDLDDKNNTPTLYEVLKDEVSITDAIQHYKDIDFVPADIALSSAEREFTQVGSEHRLRKALQPIMGDYDYILIDTPPSLGILTVNAFTVSDEIIIPVEAAYFSLKGLVKLNETIETVKEFTNEKLLVRGVLFTKFNETYNISKQMLESASEISNVINAPMFKTAIRRTIVVDEAQAAGMDLFSYKKNSTAEEDYKLFTEEYLKEVGEIND